MCVGGGVSSRCVIMLTQESLAHHVDGGIAARHVDAGNASPSPFSLLSLLIPCSLTLCAPSPLQAYEAVIKVSAAVPVEAFSVSVLRMAVWPAMTMFGATVLPPVMSACVGHFTGYFRSQGATRQVGWARSVWVTRCNRDSALGACIALFVTCDNDTLGSSPLARLRGSWRVACCDGRHKWSYAAPQHHPPPLPTPSPFNVFNPQRRHDTPRS